MVGTRAWRLVPAVAAGAGLVVALAGPAGALQADPPGNNGTVKIDGVDFDDHPNNEPHVGCVFQVDFYGFDAGDLFADVTFEVHPPTGDEVVLEDTDIFIGEDDNSGGGSEAGLDASETYDLTSALAAFEPHPQQGWHVKLTVHADGSQGADTKHKVFWVTGCGPTTTSTTSTTTPGSTTTSTTEAGAGAPSTSAPAGGVSPTGPGSTLPATSAAGELPKTGSNLVPLGVGAVALIGIGTAAGIAARRARMASGQVAP
jgi:hypothetical protein